MPGGNQINRRRTNFGKLHRQQRQKSRHATKLRQRKTVRLSMARADPLSVSVDSPALLKEQQQQLDQIENHDDSSINIMEEEEMAVDSVARSEKKRVKISTAESHVRRKLTSNPNARVYLSKKKLRLLRKNTVANNGGMISHHASTCSMALDHESTGLQKAERPSAESSMELTGTGVGTTLGGPRQL